jgi:hypothetical protein
MGAPDVVPVKSIERFSIELECKRRVDDERACAHRITRRNAVCTENLNPNYNGDEVRQGRRVNK